MFDFQNFWFVRSFKHTNQFKAIRLWNVSENYYAILQKEEKKHLLASETTLRAVLIYIRPLPPVEDPIFSRPPMEFPTAFLLRTMEFLTQFNHPHMKFLTLFTPLWLKFQSYLPLSHGISGIL